MHTYLEIAPCIFYANNLIWTEIILNQGVQLVFQYTKRKNSDGFNEGPFLPTLKYKTEDVLIITSTLF